MREAQRAGGLPNRSRVHDVPSHSQVSPMEVRFDVIGRPPNKTTLPRLASYAIAEYSREDGPVRARRLQDVPSHSQVSPEPPKPPNKVTRSLEASYVIA
jgi:hypothetical protein